MVVPPNAILFLWFSNSYYWYLVRGLDNVLFNHNFKVQVDCNGPMYTFVFFDSNFFPYGNYFASYPRFLGKCFQFCLQYQIGEMIFERLCPFSFSFYVGVSQTLNKNECPFPARIFLSVNNIDLGRRCRVVNICVNIRASSSFYNNCLYFYFNVPSIGVRHSVCSYAFEVWNRIPNRRSKGNGWIQSHFIIICQTITNFGPSVILSQFLVGRGSRRAITRVDQFVPMFKRCFPSRVLFLRRDEPICVHFCFFYSNKYKYVSYC